jgi:hypothetical protein
MSVNNKTINKNAQGTNRERAAELAPETTKPPVPATSAADAGQPFVVLDDLAPSALPSGSLASNDLKVLRAMQSILEKRQNDAWIDEMRAQITSELEWDEA